MDWFYTSADGLLRIVMTVTGVFITVIVLTRINGLRSLSKMSSYDFVVTIAIGGVIATTATSETPSLIDGIVALIALYACQWFVSWARYHHGADEFVDNEPVIVMVGDRLFEDVLETTRFTKEDIYCQLRLHNIHTFSEVQAVVLETTGDISVLHAKAADTHIDPRLLEGVRGQNIILDLQKPADANT